MEIVLPEETTIVFKTDELQFLFASLLTTLKNEASNFVKAGFVNGPPPDRVKSFHTYMNHYGNSIIMTSELARFLGKNNSNSIDDELQAHFDGVWAELEKKLEKENEK